MKVTVRLFAAYRERAGKAVLELALPDGATVGVLAGEVVRLHPSIIRDAARLAVAVNQEFSDHDHVLGDGDEVALIPPVSGG